MYIMQPVALKRKLPVRHENVAPKRHCSANAEVLFEHDYSDAACSSTDATLQGDNMKKVEGMVLAKV